MYIWKSILSHWYVFPFRCSMKFPFSTATNIERIGLKWHWRHSRSLVNWMHLYIFTYCMRKEQADDAKFEFFIKTDNSERWYLACIKLKTRVFDRNNSKSVGSKTFLNICNSILFVCVCHLLLFWFVEKPDSRFSFANNNDNNILIIQM